MNKYIKYNTRYLHRLRNFTYYNVTLPMVVVLLVKSKSILPYAIVDSGLQLNVITYCYKKCKCSEIYKNSSYYLIIFINILQLHKERQLRHMRRKCYISLYYIIIPGGNQLQYVVYFSRHNICIKYYSRRHTIHYSALILLGGLAFNIHFIHSSI